MGPNRKISDFEVAKNHAKSKRKESQISEEVVEDDDEDDWDNTEDIETKKLSLKFQDYDVSKSVQYLEPDQAKGQQG